MEMKPSGTRTTTIDLLKGTSDLDELSIKLDERLSLVAAVVSNGTGATGQPKSLGERPMDVEDSQLSSNSHTIICPELLHADKSEIVCVPESGIESDGPSPANTEEAVSPSSSTNSESVSAAAVVPEETKIEYREYESELQMPDIIRLIQRDLSEPYSIYTYRYFIHNWPELCFLAMHGDLCVGAIVCKLGMHRQIMKRGYIAMLAVDKEYRKLKIGSNLVQKAIEVSSEETRLNPAHS